ncbi:hypothetical protein [Streptomyces sp. SID1121]|uniref:hypothetical protein n=1 Tax=Streptomyces sp. SID1121 TaxID=3425888 RepID=UPI0040566CE9
MRTRRSVATAAVTGALLLGCSMGPAVAAATDTATTSSRVVRGTQGVFHYWGTYPNIGTCVGAGHQILIDDTTGRYISTRCTAFGPYQYKLWVEI